MSSDEQGADSAQRFGFEAVRGTLGVSSDVDACVTLATRINDLITQAAASLEEESADIACRKGCSFCCHLRVMVFPHEAIALFRHLGSRMSKEQAEVVRKRLLTRNISSASQACSFLVDGECAAYEARPAACSAYHSLSKEKCEESYNNGGHLPAGIPVLKALRFVAAALDEGMEQGLNATGLSVTRLELNAAVAALVRNPALIQRWRSGRELKI